MELMLQSVRLLMIAYCRSAAVMLTPWLVALVAAAFPLVACGAQTPATVKVVLDNDYPPYSFLDKNGDPQGILKDLWSLRPPSPKVR